MEKVRTLKPDAVLLDLRMPGMDGFEVLNRLRADARSRSLPVVVVTSKRLTPNERSLLVQHEAVLLTKDTLSRPEATADIRRALAGAGLRGVEPAGVESNTGPAA